MTSQEGGGGASLVGSSLTRLVQNLWDQLSSSGPTAQLGMGPLALAEKESRRWALGMEDWTYQKTGGHPSQPRKKSRQGE